MKLKCSTFDLHRYIFFLQNLLKCSFTILYISKMSKIYKAVIGVLDKIVPTKLKPIWDHPAGPKTIFFWAPAFKWGLVLAGIGDILSRHPSQISISQSTALAMTGLIWSRYSVVIIPVNYNLLSVNAFVATTQLYQLYRAIDYQQKNPPEGK